MGYNGTFQYIHSIQLHEKLMIMTMKTFNLI